jgi:hypothetical protein
LTEDKYKSEEMKAKNKALDENVNKVLGKAYNPADNFNNDPDMSDMDTPTYDMYEDNKGAYSQVPDI